MTGAAELEPAIVCRVCGCCDPDPCLTEDGGVCSWIEADLCSECRGLEGEPLLYDARGAPLVLK